MKRYWMGEDIDTLPRERLLEIIDHLNRILENVRRGVVGNTIYVVEPNTMDEK